MFAIRQPGYWAAAKSAAPISIHNARLSHLPRRPFYHTHSELRQGSCERYTLGGGLGAAEPPLDPTIGEAWRGLRPPPSLPNCKADRYQAKPCLRVRS